MAVTFPKYHNQCRFHRVLTPEKIRELYPNGRVKQDSKKIFVMNTMFNLAETCLLSQTLDFYENCPGAEVTRTGVTVSGKIMTFEDIFKVSNYFLKLFEAIFALFRISGQL